MKLVIEFLEHLTPYGNYGYVIMFLVLLACGFGFPMPEDVVLVTGGILSALKVTDFWLTMLVCLVGVLLGDSIVFTIGNKMGPRLKLTSLYKRIMPAAREKQVMTWFARYGDKVIFFARFAPGLRMPLFLTAGMYHVPFWKFLCLDGFAAIISVPAWVWVGHLFGENLDALEAKMRQMQMGIYSILSIILVASVIYIVLKRKIKARAQAVTEHPQ